MGGPGQAALTEVVPAAEVRVLPRMTEEEFVAWCDEDTRAEFVDGEVIVFSPSSTRHVLLCNFLSTLLRVYVDAHQLGVVGGPEWQVRLRPGLRRVPDVLFVSRERMSIICETHIEGPPDLVMEVVSPDSEERDWRDKYWDYEQAGVREYWVIEPYTKVLVLYRLDEEGKYRRVEPEGGFLASGVVPGFKIRPEWLWQEPLPSVVEALRESGLVLMREK